MIVLNYIVTEEQGLHATPSGMLVKITSKMKSKITVKQGERKEDARNIFGLMALRIRQGQEIQVLIEGETEMEDAKTIKEFLEENL